MHKDMHYFPCLNSVLPIAVSSFPLLNIEGNFLINSIFILAFKPNLWSFSAWTSYSQQHQCFPFPVPIRARMPIPLPCACPCVSGEWPLRQGLESPLLTFPAGGKTSQALISSVLQGDCNKRGVAVIDMKAQRVLKA